MLLELKTVASYIIISRLPLPMAVEREIPNFPVTSASRFGSVAGSRAATSGARSTRSNAFAHDASAFAGYPGYAATYATHAYAYVDSPK